MRVLGLIPARGGSKGLPRKNIRPLGGRPLLAYTADAALSAKSLARVVLSTDDEEIADVGRHCGLSVPFIRPPELAEDETPTLPVVQHAIQALERDGEGYDAVCVLQPTSPFRPPDLIDTCIQRLVAARADTVITVLAVPTEYNPHWVYVPTADGTLQLSTGERTPIPRRQALPPAFHRDGSVYVTRRDVVIEGGSLYGKRIVGVQVETSRSVNIDTPSDWKRAEAILTGGGSAPPVN